MRSPFLYLVLALLGLWFADRHRRADEPFMMSVMACGAILMLVLAVQSWRRGRADRAG